MEPQNTNTTETHQTITIRTEAKEAKVDPSDSKEPEDVVIAVVSSVGGLVIAAVISGVLFFVVRRRRYLSFVS